MSKQQYNQELERFQANCQKLIKSGMAYMVVILNHELFRYLYPYEPYARFTHRDPVKMAVHHIKTLNVLAENSRKGITPYSFDSKHYMLVGKKISVEKKTSDLYTELWKPFEEEILNNESYKLITGRLNQTIVKNYIRGKRVLDMGCGSGRYSIALSMIGAKEVVAVDYQEKSFQNAKKFCQSKRLNVQFREANCLKLPFKRESFDFVFSNGVLHHTRSIKNGLSELERVLKRGGKSFLYIYAKGGIFWETRLIMRKIFAKIPLSYTQSVLDIIGMPKHRFFFCDVWYVPIETHTSKYHLENMFKHLKLDYQKIISKNKFDLDRAINSEIKNAASMWGDGEHRYLLSKA